MKKQKKPVGRLGPITISPHGAIFDEVAFPQEKASLESFILQLTLAGLEQQGKNPWGLVGGMDPERLPEDDFDFRIPLSPPEYLDLMEVVPGGKGHAGATFDVNSGEMAEAVWAEITKKSLHYGPLQRRHPKVHLLLYSTNLGFRLTDEVRQLLAYFLQVTEGRGFSSVVYSVPESRDSAFVDVLFPRPSTEFRGISLRKLRGQRSLIADFSRATVNPDGSVSVPVGGKKTP